MDRSNYTLRFARSARESYGSDIAFDDQKSPDMPVILACVFAFGVLVGLFASGALP